MSALDGSRFFMKVRNYPANNMLSQVVVSSWRTKLLTE